MSIVEIIIPKTGAEMEEAKIISWKKHEGERVNKGEVLLEIETDKAVMDVEAPDSGILLKRYYQEGQTAPATQRIAILGTAGESPEDPGV